MSEITLEKKSIYPCKPATTEAILDTIAGAGSGSVVEAQKLREFTHPIAEKQIPWSCIHHVCAIGTLEGACNSALKNSGLRSGVYTSHNGDWLILIHPKVTTIQEYTNRCAEEIFSLTICNVGLQSLNLSHLTQLRELYLPGCKSLTQLPALESLTQLNILCLIGCDHLTHLPLLNGLTQLTVLDLYGCRNLEELPPLDSMTQLNSLDLRGCESLTQLQPFDNLTQLTELNLYGCRNLKELPSLDNLTQLTELGLSGCSSLAQLPPLDSLTQLTVLDLSGCSSLAQLPPLDSLTQLTGLYLSRCSSLIQLPSLDSQVQLTTLNLSGCSSLTQLPSLDSLSQLTSLNLSRCHTLTQLYSSGSLMQLTSLDLSRCSSITEIQLSGCSSLTQLAPLDGLEQLTTLNLSGAASLTRIFSLFRLKQLTTLNLSGCSSLTGLDLSECRSLTALNLSGCESLVGLDLSQCISLTQLLGLGSLNRLTKLLLSGCSSLTELPGLGNLTQLTSLDLSGCSFFTELPAELRRMDSLRMLNLQHLELRDLPNWLSEIAESFSLERFDFDSGTYEAAVNLYGTTVETIPDMSIFNQPYEMIVDFFRNRKLGDIHPLNEIKVVFLGDGEAGKSHTIARLMNDGGNPDHAVFDGQSTPGIVIRNKEYDLGDRKITVHYWDFGGQEIMHSMHRIFLTGRTMYVILLNARDDTQSDRAKYWLHNVKSFASDAPVLLVLNKIDQNPNASVDEKDLRSRYGKLTQVVRLSAKDFSREEFNSAFTRVLLKEIEDTGFLDAQWPTTWTRVKERLEKMESHYIMGDAYEDICLECQVNENQENLLHWFNDLGISFCCRDAGDYALKDYVILRPDWITNALYIILFNTLGGTRNGLIPHSSIFSILSTSHKNPAIRCTLPSARYNSGDIQYVLGIMRKFNLSFTDGHENEFIPMLCQQNSMVDIQYCHKDAEILEFNMEFDYLPNNLLHRLMVERSSELDMTAVWRTGARFTLPGTGLSAVLVIDGEILRFFIRHTDPMHRPNTYLTMLKAHVDRIVAKMGLKAPSCKLVYKLDGKRDEFHFENLKLWQKLGMPGVPSPSHGIIIPFQDILNQAAPDNLDDEKKLLDKILQACGNIQDDPIYRLVPKSDGQGYVNGQGMEDLRNRRIRDNLINIGYRMSDQTQRGVSSTRKSVGELDMLVYNDSNKPWTIIEALRVSNKDKSDWNSHLKKLSDNYNTRGFPALYLLTYVDAGTADFAQICDSYRNHIKTYHPGQMKYMDGSLTELNVPRSQYIKVIKCRYSSSGDPIAVYHIFVLIPIKNG